MPGISGSPVHVHELRSNERKNWSKVLLERNELFEPFLLNELNCSKSSSERTELFEQFLLKWTDSTIYFNSHFIEKQVLRKVQFARKELFEQFSSFKKELFEKFSTLKRTVRSVPFVDNTVSNSSSVLNETWTCVGLVFTKYYGWNHLNS